MNIGAKNANGKYLILLNNDTIVGEGWDAELIKPLERDNNIFVVSPLTSYSSNISRLSIKHTSPTHFFEKVNRLKKYLVSDFEADSLILFCGCFRRNNFINIGYLNENYLNGWEDDDLYEQIIKINKKALISTKSVVYHFGSITVGRNAYDVKNNPNRLYFEKKWKKKWITKYKQKYITENNDGMINYVSKNNIHNFIIQNYKNESMLKYITNYQNSIQIDDTLYNYLYAPAGNKQSDAV